MSVNTGLVFCTLRSPIDCRHQSFQLCGALNGFEKTGFHVFISKPTIIIVNKWSEGGDELRQVPTKAMRLPGWRNVVAVVSVREYIVQKYIVRNVIRGKLKIELVTYIELHGFFWIWPR